MSYLIKAYETGGSVDKFNYKKYCIELKTPNINTLLKNILPLYSLPLYRYTPTL
ncbi:hypothetical protein VCHA47P369_110021 [Vibrio chagasii]|nr:hypothetical protein VCHA34P114_100128 [Vibrio chagasii]CAH6807416.1 hypothetical protein VCHA36P168_110053 [Vibrio chagasii]CAH6904692.1 hypothetical protein VCHA50O407_100067 [Vibrio chagasii]CAH6906666.1 hypothetical protein VCHA43P282_100053 [Vibrio chagasii]CAH6910931.1 hypothetical protein VCHA48P435_100137 [Vibrio chagasii]